MDFHTLVQDGISRIYSEDFNTQVSYIDFICGKVRGMDPSVIYDAEGFFIPNDEYILQFFSDEILDPAYEFYDGTGCCSWAGYLVFPIKNIGGNVVGLGGFSPELYVRAHEENDWSLAYYKYSSKKIFTKGHYLYTLPSVFDKALDDGYVIVVDGLFDALSLIGCGYNAMALMSSSLTEITLAQLRFFNKVIVIADNDDAGLMLVNKLKKHLNNVISVKQGKTKDVDALLKTENKDKFLKLLDSIISENTVMNHCSVFS